MADLGVLRTFVKNFSDALDIMDEGERLKGLVEERRQAVAEFMVELDRQSAALTASKQATREAMTAQQAAQASFETALAEARHQQKAMQAESTRQLQSLQATYEERRSMMERQLTELQAQITARQGEFEAMTQQVAQIRSTMKELVLKAGSLISSRTS